MAEVPSNVIAAVNALLAPYGRTYAVASSDGGYLRALDAARYLGISRMSLNRLVRSGYISPIKIMSDTKKGAVVYSITELEAYARSRRRDDSDTFSDNIRIRR